MNMNSNTWNDFFEWWRKYFLSDIDLTDIKAWQEITEEHGSKLITSTIECIHSKGKRPPKPKQVKKVLAKSTTKPPASVTHNDPNQDQSDTAYLKRAKMSDDELASIAAGWASCEDAMRIICADVDMYNDFWRYLDRQPMASYYRRVWHDGDGINNRFIICQAGHYYNSSQRLASK